MMNRVAIKNIDELKDTGGHFEHSDSNRPGRDDLKNKVDPRKIKKEDRKDYSDTLFDKDLKTASFLNDVEILNCVNDKAKYLVIANDFVTIYFNNGTNVTAHPTESLRELCDSGFVVDGAKYFVFPGTKENIDDFVKNVLHVDNFNIDEDYELRKLADFIFLNRINGLYD